MYRDSCFAQYIYYSCLCTQAASDRLMKSKRTVAHEIARKAAARLTIASTKEEVHRGPHRPGESQPSDQGPPLLTSDSNDLEYSHLPLVKTSPRVPCSHVQQMGREAYSRRTWQRGYRAVQEKDQHFPLIAANLSPSLMYSMMQPPANQHKVVDHEVSSKSSISANSSSCQ